MGVYIATLMKRTKQNSYKTSQPRPFSLPPSLLLHVSFPSFFLCFPFLSFISFFLKYPFLNVTFSDQWRVGIQQLNFFLIPAFSLYFNGPTIAVIQQPRAEVCIESEQIAQYKQYLWLSRRKALWKAEWVECLSLPVYHVNIAGNTAARVGCVQCGTCPFSGIFISLCLVSSVSPLLNVNQFEG